MRRGATIVGLALLAGSAGCYSQEPILELSRHNERYLERLEVKLSLSSDQVGEYEALPDQDKPAFLAQHRRDNIAELRDLFGDTSAVRARLMLDMRDAFARHGVASTVAAADRPPALNFELAALQETYYRALDEVRRRGAIVDGYEDLIKALQVLRMSSENLDEYLEMSSFARWFTEAKALDREKLKKIGEDLRVVAERLKPLVLPQ